MFLLAETATGYAIDLNPFLNVLWSALGVVLTAVASVIALRVKQKWGVTIDQKTVDTALQNGLQLAQKTVAAENIGSIIVQKKIIADAANYVIAHVPDALQNVGTDVSTPEGRASLEQKIEARLAPAVLAGAATEMPTTVAAAAAIANPNVATAPIVPDSVPKVMR